MNSSVLIALVLVVVTTTAPSFDRALADLADERLRPAAISALASMGPSVAERLSRAAPGRPEAVQEAIVEALIQIGPAGLSDLVRCSGCSAGIRAAARMGEGILPQLEEWFPFRSAERGDFAARCLRAMGPRLALPVLERLTRHPDEQVRRAAFNIMVSWDDPRVADSLFREISSPDVWLRRQAIHGLGTLRDPRVVEPALRYIQDDSLWGLQEQSAFALGGQYRKAFRLPLVKASRHASEIMVRRTAADVLEAAKDPVANRLGRRYSVISVGPSVQGEIWTRYKMMLFGTAMAALLLLRVANLLPGRLAIAIVVLAAGGFVWGDLMTKINGSVERELLFFWIPGVWLVARVMGTKMSNLKDLLIPLLTAFAGAFAGSVLVMILLRLMPVGAMIVGMYGWVLVALGFVAGIVVALRRSKRRRETERATPHDVAFTRLATVGCLAFYAGYVFGWWKLWDYSAEAFKALI